MIRTIVVDDDLLHIESLVKILTENFKQVEIVATCSSVPIGVKMIDELKPQLVFLDIEMAPYTGFDLLEMVDERSFEVIFTTSYQKYAIQAIKASALDYIEKPLDGMMLSETLTRFKAKAGEAKIKNLLSNFKTNTQNQKIALCDNSGHNFFEVMNIIRCESDNSFTDFHIWDNNKVVKFTVSKGLYHFEDFLFATGLFFRVHNKHLVNVNHIKKYAKDNGGYLIMDDKTGVTIPIARARKDDLMFFLRSKEMIF